MLCGLSAKCTWICMCYLLVYHYCSWATVFMTMCQHTMSPWQHHVWDTEWGEVMGKYLAACFCVHIVSLCWQDETGSKLDGRGDSAVSKGTKDSGVVMEENRELPVLPGALPRKLPPLTRVGESEADRVTEDGECLPQTRWINQTASHCRENPMHTTYQCYCFVRLWGLRQQSSEILEELLNEGIIPVGQRGSAAGEAYSIMVRTCETCKHHLSTRSTGRVTL